MFLNFQRKNQNIHRKHRKCVSHPLNQRWSKPISISRWRMLYFNEFYITLLNRKLNFSTSISTLCRTVCITKRPNTKIHASNSRMSTIYYFYDTVRLANFSSSSTLIIMSCVRDQQTHTVAFASFDSRTKLFIIGRRTYSLSPAVVVSARAFRRSSHLKIWPNQQQILVFGETLKFDVRNVQKHKWQYTLLFKMMPYFQVLLSLHFWGERTTETYLLMHWRIIKKYSSECCAYLDSRLTHRSNEFSEAMGSKAIFYLVWLLLLICRNEYCAVLCLFVRCFCVLVLTWSLIIDIDAMLRFCALTYSTISAEELKESE